MTLNVAKHHALIAVNETIDKLMKLEAWGLVAKAQDWRYALQGGTCKPSVARKAMTTLLERASGG